jgi:HEAT repeat protein
MTQARHRPTCITPQQRKRGRLPALRVAGDVAAVQVAALLAPAGAVGVWRRELQRGSKGRRAAAAVALVSRLGPRAVVVVQHALLTDAHAWVREQAARALALVPGRASARALLAAHQTERDPAVRAAVVTSLGRQDARQPGVVDVVHGSALASEATECAAGILALTALQVHAGDVLAAVLGHASLEVRRAAAVLATSMGAGSVLESLRQDEDTVVARLAGA